MLRGIWAAAIMIYHFCYWLSLGGSEPVHFALQKIGIYRVEIFFVVSGFSLAIAYRDKSFTKRDNWSAFYQRGFDASRRS